MEKCSTIIEKPPNLEEILLKAKCRNFHLGNVKDTKHSIKLKNSIPIISKAYKITQAFEEDVQFEIKRLISEKIIKESTLEYASSAFPARKKNGSIKLSNDYRKLNQKTIKEI